MIVSWSSRSGNQSILKEISPEYSLEGLMLKLKLQYFGHLMQKKTDSLEKTQMPGKFDCRRPKWRQDEYVGWHLRLHVQEFKQGTGVGDEQRSHQRVQATSLRWNSSEVEAQRSHEICLRSNRSDNLPEITQLRCRNTERSEDLRKSTQLRSGNREVRQAV